MIGADPTVSTAENYARFGREAKGESPLYEQFGLGVSTDRDVLARLDALPAPKRQPNLLFAAATFVAGIAGDYAAFRETVLTRWDEISAQMRTRSTQTNEAGRCATLLPFLARLPQPLALLEVGASAGLCLLPDRYRYEYTDAAGQVTSLGPPAASVTLPCAIDGIVVPTSVPTVVWRAGLDLHPVDLADPGQVAWLDALVWPEADLRRARLHAAVDVARADPPRVVAGDLRTGLLDLAAQAPAEATLVVFHSAVIAYLDPADRATFAQTVRSLDSTWIANESPSVSVDLGVDVPAGVEDGFIISVDGRARAQAHGHGSWVRSL